MSANRKLCRQLHSSARERGRCRHPMSIPVRVHWTVAPRSFRSTHTENLQPQTVTYRARQISPQGHDSGCACRFERGHAPCGDEHVVKHVIFFQAEARLSTQNDRRHILYPKLPVGSTRLSMKDQMQRLQAKFWKQPSQHHPVHSAGCPTQPESRQRRHKMYSACPVTQPEARKGPQHVPVLVTQQFQLGWCQRRP